MAARNGHDLPRLLRGRPTRHGGAVLMAGLRPV